jgi:NADH-ubiquinone oxidoreductase chain 6
VVIKILKMKINFFNLIIEIITILSIIFALAVITSTNPVIAIIFLIGLFLSAAAYLILMGLNFIGISYLLVYIGAITVLILFIVMMISTDILHTVEVGTDYSKLLPLAYTIAILFILLFLTIIPSFIIDFSSFEIYNFINNIILTIFNKETYSLNILNSSILNIHYYLNKIGLGFLLNSFVNSENTLNSENITAFNDLQNNGPFYYQPLFNRDIYVEYNPSTYSLIGSGKNPTGFYYWHPLKTEAVNKGIESYQYLNNSPFYFPLGWYTDEPYALFSEWVSNKNINLFLWSDIKTNLLTGWVHSQHAGFNFDAKLWSNFAYNLFSPFSASNYGGSNYAPWYTISYNLPWNTIFSPVYGIPLHNDALNLSWLNIPYYPEFLIEFPNSPVYSPNYFLNTQNSFGEVYHSIETFNNTTNDLLLNNIEPATLLHKNLQIQSLGQSIFGRYSLLLILSSFLLLLAMVAPILLTRNSKNN